MCGWQVKLCDPLVTSGPYLSALEIRSLYIKCYINSPSLLFFTFYNAFSGEISNDNLQHPEVVQFLVCHLQRWMHCSGFRCGRPGSDCRSWWGQVGGREWEHWTQVHYASSSKNSQFSHLCTCHHKSTHAWNTYIQYLFSSPLLRARLSCWQQKLIKIGTKLIKIKVPSSLLTESRIPTVWRDTLRLTVKERHASHNDSCSINYLQHAGLTVSQNAPEHCSRNWEFTPGAFQLQNYWISQPELTFLGPAS